VAAAAAAAESPTTFMAGGLVLSSKKSADMKDHVGATGESTFKHIPHAFSEEARSALSPVN
jgi:hypothetical protein